MFNKILVPTDGSDHAGKAVEIAADIAVKYDAELVVLNVRRPGRLPQEMRRMAEVEHLVDPTQSELPNVADVSAGFAAAMARDEQRERAINEAYLKIGEQIVAQARAIARSKGLEKITTEVASGDPARRIINAAKEHDADLIVMGNRGLSDLKGLLVGSVSHKVGQLCHCTCITVK